MIYLLINGGLMNLDRNMLEDSLNLLGELLEAEATRPVHLVVSGGAALLAAKISVITTNDVDVIAMRGEIDGEIISATPLPDFLKTAVKRVADELRLIPNWLNASTSALMIDLNRFPGNFLSDVIETHYGRNLKVTFIGRSGQVHLKMYAAANRDEARDLRDLKALNLSPAEAEKSALWLFEEEVIDKANKDRVFSILQEIGHDEVIDRIDRKIS